MTQADYWEYKDLQGVSKVTMCLKKDNVSSGGNNEPFIQNQNARLGFFLTASAFLVIAFITLITLSDTSYLLVEKEHLYKPIIHAVAALGSFIAAIYTFMNLWATLGRREPLLNTWVVPAAFLAFWLSTWFLFTDCSYIFIILILFPMFWIYEKFLRKKNSETITPTTHSQ
ncbi:hypothetical protein ACFLS8_05705 [Chloroflexota bacterium]